MLKQEERGSSGINKIVCGASSPVAIKQCMHKQALARRVWRQVLPENIDAIVVKLPLESFLFLFLFSV